MSGRLWAAVVPVALGLVGCKSIAKEIIREVVEESSSGSGSDAETADLSGPTKVVEVEWVEPNKFQIPGEPDQYGTVSIYEGTYQATLHGMPKGSEFTVEGKTTKVDSSIFDIIKIKDMQPHFGKLKIADLSGMTLDPDLTAELRLPGMRSTIKLPPARLLGLDDLLEKVENTPVTFEGEPEKTDETFSVLSLMSITPKVFGKATTLQDVDAIALTRRLETVKGKKLCTGYKDKNKKPKPDITLLLKATEAVIYDRRTSEVVAKKVFDPSQRCPMFTMGKDKTQNSSTPTTQIEDWLRSHVKR